MSRLNIKVFSDKTCELYAIDDSVYSELSDITKHVFVEFLCEFPYQEDETTLLALDNTKKITMFNQSLSLDREYVYKLKKDGRYRYYKYGVYTYDHPYVYDGASYNISGKVFFYEGKIYMGLNNVATADLIPTNSKVITNWYTLRDQVPQNIEFWYDKEIFSICNLNQCLVALEKKVLFEGLKNCNLGECDKDKEVKSQRDFLFIAVFVLDYLKDVGNYDEAQRILESLSSCGSLCGDKSYKNNCGCG